MVSGIFCCFHNDTICICSDGLDDGNVRQRKGDGMNYVCCNGAKMTVRGGDEGGNMISACNNGVMIVQGGDKGGTICVYSSDAIQKKGKPLKVDNEL